MRGDVQLTSAATGISHSEKTHGAREVHFLQIWTTPSANRLPPKYFTRHFKDAEKRDALVRVVAPVGADGVSTDRDAAGPAPVNSPVSLFATILSPGGDVVHRVPRAAATVYVHVIHTSGYNTEAATGVTVQVVGTRLREGDGAFVYAENAGDEITLSNIGDSLYMYYCAPCTFLPCFPQV